MELEELLLVLLLERPTEQLEAFEELLDYLDGKEMKIDGWDFCRNGCCIKVVCVGYDETAWSVTPEGEIAKQDRYGNFEELEI